MTGRDSLAHNLHFVLDSLVSIDSASTQVRRQRIGEYLDQDADWENPATMMDPTKSVGCYPAATRLWIEIEEFIIKLRLRRPELVARGDESCYPKAVQYKTVARQLFNYTAALARASCERVSRTSRHSRPDDGG